MKKVLFSGCGPSGILTIGNHIGAIRQWIRFQESYESFFCIVDLHAITTPQNPVMLRETSLDFLALYVACDLDPEKSTVFVQSQNPHHTELAWILNCCTAYGDLARMTQFKDKSGKQKMITAGLLNYPILMAADILLYQTDLVPIGDDQQQHLELSRVIARRFNRQFGDVFTVPEGMSPQTGGRIRNLLDPSRKMDKSHENEKTYISLLDTDDQVRSKIMKAKTDSDGDFNISDPNEGITNLVTIYAKLTNSNLEETVDQYRNRGYGRFKKDLAERVIDFLRPIQDRFSAIRQDSKLLNSLLTRGRERAMAQSKVTLKRVKEACGLQPND